jgi:hypothetical protein
MSGAGIEPANDETGVLAAETERVLRYDVDLKLAGLIADDI